VWYIGEVCSQKDDFRDMEVPTNLEKSTTEGFPFELWFEALEEDYIVAEFGSLVCKKLVCRPCNCALYPIHEFDSGTYLCKNKKVFGIDFSDFLWVPAIDQKLDGSCCRVCCVVPSPEGNDKNGVT